MSSGANPIGNLSIIVDADLTELQSSLAEIPGLLANVGGNVNVNAATGAFDELGQSIDKVGTSATSAETDLATLGSGLTQAEGGAKETESALGGVTESLTSLAAEAGIAFSAYELLKTSFEDFATIQKAQIALTAMTGDADGAAVSIERLRDLALDNGLNFEALVGADQKMVAFGFDAAQIPRVLQAVADAAAATGNSIDAVANAVDRLAISGTAGARQLATLGLNLQILATAINEVNPALDATATTAAAAFKELDMADRVEVLTDALAKFGGVGQQVGQSLSGQWQDTKTQLEAAFEGIGGALAPLATSFLAFFNEIVKGAMDGIVAIKGLIAAANAGSSGGGLAGTEQAPSYLQGLGQQQNLLQYIQSLSAPPNNNPLGGSAPNLAPSSTGGDIATLAASSVNSAAAAFQKLGDDLTAAQANLALVNTAMKDGAATAAQQAAAVQAVRDAFVAANPQFKENSEFTLTANDLLGQFTDSEKLAAVNIQAVSGQVTAANPAWAEYYQSLVDSAQAAKDAAAGYQQGQDQIVALAAALPKLTDITIKQTGANKDALDSFTKIDNQGYKQLIVDIPAATDLGGQFHDEVVAQIPDVSELQSKLTDATTAYNNIKNATDASGQSLYNNTQQIQAHITQLNADIAVQQSAGNNTDRLRQEVDQLTQSLQQQPTWWTAMNNAALQVTKTIETQLGSALTSIIDGTSSVSAAFEKMGESVLNIILNTIIKQGITELLNSLANVDGIIGTIAKDFGGVASQATAAGTSLASATGLGNSAASIGASGTGAIGDTVGTGDTLAGVGGSAGSAVGSSISGIISTVSSVVTAVSSIATAIGTFIEGGKENANLFDIKVTLAGISNILFQIQQRDMDPIANFFTGYPDYLYNVQHADLVNIWGELQDGVTAHLAIVANTLNSIYDVMLLSVGIQAKSAPTGTLNVTLTNTDPKQVAENIAAYLGLTAPGFV